MSCPICGKKTQIEFRPFCCKRCADRDLARWFNGSYAVPSVDADDADDIENAMEEAARNPAKPH
ncbi:DNA gyrase inhibitor YacG [Roseobacter sp. EG26]|uniref:DNA gyrase inhibitor YacG n=1 Tax=Roseobacter sp. EG26 TaxID=3412477 RepID=UPI003CE46A5F